MRKDILGKLFLLLLLSPAVMHAQVITEVFYSPQSRSWIEVYNDTSSNLDLTKYKVLDAGAATNGHGVSFISGNATVAPGSFAVIAKDPTTLPSLSVPIFKSALAAKTSGDTISLKDAVGNIADTFSFSSSLGASGDGNSLQKFDTGWSAAPPTPGATNLAPVLSMIPPDATSTATTSDAGASIVTPIYSSHYSFVPLSDTPSEKLSASVGRDRLGFVGVPLAFKAITDTNDGNASYFWSFGDGGEEQGKEVAHAYLYPGTYVLVLNVKLFEYEAVSRATIKIVVPEVSVSSANLDLIELKNDSDYEMNLYGFRLREGAKVFEFPMDTIVNAKAKVVLPKAVTKLSPAAPSQVKLEAKSLPLPVAAEPEPAQSLAMGTASTLNEHAEEIQALGDKLVSLNMELFAMDNPTYFAKVPADPIIEPEVVETAAVVQAVASSSWKTTLKHFFRR